MEKEKRGVLIRVVKKLKPSPYLIEGSLLFFPLLILISFCYL